MYFFSFFILLLCKELYYHSVMYLKFSSNINHHIRKIFATILKDY